METLLSRRAGWLRSAHVALVSHAAALNRDGVSSADLLRRSPAWRLVSLLGPEHGYWGLGGAGEAVAGEKRAVLGVPIHSLYGTARRPTAAMLRGADLIVVDLQDIAARCYTYVSTLRHVLEAAAQYGKPVIVADRPVPLPRAVDGPTLDPRFESFVAFVRAPLAYGLTPGEAARWICRDLELDLDLRVSTMDGYRRDAARGADWPPWCPPSPGIRSWESAMCYTATVVSEALPAIDVQRAGPLPFQVVLAPWMKPRAVLDVLAAADLPGVAFHYHRGRAAAGPADGIRLAVTDPAAFRPVTTGVHVLRALQAVHGADAVWSAPGTRAGFFDQLMGTSQVRAALTGGATAEAIVADWASGLAAFRATRASALLYPED